MKTKLSNIQYISFDLDGTLVDQEFADVVWHRGIPELYAEKMGLPFAQAQETILREYGNVGDGALEWYSIDYWFKYLGLPGRWKDLLEKYSSLVRIYPEVHDVLNRLRERFTLVVLSNAAREFVDIEMRMTDLSGYFQDIISATSDFSLVKKSHEFYRAICDKINVSPQDMIHVGDHWEYDYLAPKGIGIVAFHLDRSQGRDGPEVVKDLRSLEEILSG